MKNADLFLLLFNTILLLTTCNMMAYFFVRGALPPLPHPPPPYSTRPFCFPPPPPYSTRPFSFPPPPLEQSYYKLVLQWPQSFCFNEVHRRCKVIPNIFTIHGVWIEPQQNTAEQCLNEEFNMTKLKDEGNDLVPKLLEYWPSLLFKFSDYRFWKHEWNKHGKCTKLLPGEYFRRAVDKGSYYINQLADSTRLLPRRRGYDFSVFYDKVEVIIQTKFKIKCNQKLERYQTRKPRSKSQLSEIVICLDLSWNPIPCPLWYKSSCDSKIYYPPSPQVGSSSSGTRGR